MQRPTAPTGTFNLKPYTTANGVPSEYTLLTEKLDAVKARRDYCESMAQRISDYWDTKERLKIHARRVTGMAVSPQLAPRHNIDNDESYSAMRRWHWTPHIRIHIMNRRMSSQ